MPHPTAPAASPPQPHPILGDAVADQAALRVWQSTPVELRRADPSGVWARCLSIAHSLRRAGR